MGDSSVLWSCPGPGYTGQIDVYFDNSFSGATFHTTYRIYYDQDSKMYEWRCIPWGFTDVGTCKNSDANASHAASWASCH